MSTLVPEANTERFPVIERKKGWEATSIDSTGILTIKATETRRSIASGFAEKYLSIHTNANGPPTGKNPHLSPLKMY
jgi:hypothetical protein